MTEPLISVIVPVYKVEQYLEKCVNSIIDQTYDNLEVVLVDDGSPDNCPAMCDRYAEQDVRVKVIHKENGGQSSARNLGLAQAKGEYILFVDSDDWIHVETCERLLRQAQEMRCDIVYGNYIEVRGTVEQPAPKTSILQSEVFAGKDFLAYNIRNKTMTTAVWCGLYKRSLIVDNNILFEEGVVHEDELWIPQVFLNAKRVVYLDFAFYYYYQNQNSTMNSTSMAAREKRANDLVFICQKLYALYSKTSEPERSLFYDYVCMLYLSAAYVGKLKQIDRKFPLRLAQSPYNYAKARLYALSPTVYFQVNKAVKYVTARMRRVRVKE